MSPKKFDKHFGKRLRAIREGRRISVRKLAKLVGIHPTYLSKIERGELPPPAWDKILALGSHLKSEPLLQLACGSILDALRERAVFISHSLWDAFVEICSEPDTFAHRESVEQEIMMMKQLFEEITGMIEAAKMKITKQ